MNSWVDFAPPIQRSPVPLPSSAAPLAQRPPFMYSLRVPPSWTAQTCCQPVTAPAPVRLRPPPNTHRPSPWIQRPYHGFASRDLVTTPFQPSWGTSFRWTQAEIEKLSDDLNDRSAAWGKTRWSSWPSNATPLRPEISTGLCPATSF